MGAAKVHMLMMSGVGAMAPATMKMPRIAVTQVAPHPARADDAEQGEEEDQDRHLKDHAEAEHDRHEQTDVLVDGDHGSELRC